MLRSFRTGLIAAVSVLVMLPAAATAALSWSAPAAVDANGAQPLTGIACPSSTQCVAVDSSGQEVSFNPGSPGAPAPHSVDATGGALTSVACSSGTQCTA